MRDRLREAVEASGSVTDPLLLILSCAICFVRSAAHDPAPHRTGHRRASCPDFGSYGFNTSGPYSVPIGSHGPRLRATQLTHRRPLEFARIAVQPARKSSFHLGGPQSRAMTDEGHESALTAVGIILMIFVRFTGWCGPQRTEPPIERAPPAPYRPGSLSDRTAYGAQLRRRMRADSVRIRRRQRILSASSLDDHHAAANFPLLAKPRGTSRPAWARSPFHSFSSAGVQLRLF